MTPVNWVRAASSEKPIWCKSKEEAQIIIRLLYKIQLENFSFASYGTENEEGYASLFRYSECRLYISFNNEFCRVSQSREQPEYSENSISFQDAYKALTATPFILDIYKEF